MLLFPQLNLYNFSSYLSTQLFTTLFKHILNQLLEPTMLFNHLSLLPVVALVMAAASLPVGPNNFPIEHLTVPSPSEACHRKFALAKSY